MQLSEEKFQLLIKTVYQPSSSCKTDQALANHRQTIQTLVEFCEAKSLDPFDKPVHPTPVGGITQYLPSIDTMRAWSESTGNLAGLSKPEFGEMQTKVWGTDNRAVTVTFPESVTMTMRKRLATGEIAEFTHTEYWEECCVLDRYGKPNMMWRHSRTRGQLVKCCEAQLHRKAFPSVNKFYSVEEMAGREELSEQPPEEETTQQAAVQSNEFMPVSTEQAEPTPHAVQAETEPRLVPEVSIAVETKPGCLRPSQLKIVRTFAQRNNIAESTLAADFNCEHLEDIPGEMINAVLAKAKQSQGVNHGQ